MTPLYFGSGARRLFGVYTPARSTAGPARAAVLCHPLGQEYLCAHRSMRQLGNLLAGRGYHVLRFDYYGTGDSAGDLPEADLADWESDIATAIEELRDTTGAQKVSLVGLRLGATLAAGAAARRPGEIASLVLWDPIVSGRDYLDELMRGELELDAPEPAKPRPAALGGGHEVFGFALSGHLETQIGAIDLLSLVPTLTARHLTLVTRPTPAHDRLREALASRDTAVLEDSDDAPAWTNSGRSGAGAVPVKLLQRIAHWLSP